MINFTVINDRQQCLEIELEQFNGFEIFELANHYWGDDWQSYQVISDQGILEKVINPNYLDPKSAMTIQ